MRQAEFAELSREVMPVLDKLTEIAGQHEEAGKVEEKEHEQSKKHDNRGRLSAPERRLQESQENGSTAI